MNRNNAEIYLSPPDKVKRVNKADGYFIYEGRTRQHDALDTDRSWSIKRIEVTENESGEFTIEEKWPNGIRAQSFAFSEAESYNFYYFLKK